MLFVRCDEVRRDSVEVVQRLLCGLAPSRRLQLAENVVGARSLEPWFYSATEAGQLIRRAQRVMKERGTADDFVVQYILPGTQAG